MLQAAKQPQNIAGTSNNVNKELVFTNSWGIPVEILQIMVRVDQWFWPETSIDLTVSFRLKEGEALVSLETKETTGITDFGSYIQPFAWINAGIFILYIISLMEQPDSRVS